MRNLEGIHIMSYFAHLEINKIKCFEKHTSSELNRDPQLLVKDLDASLKRPKNISVLVINQEIFTQRSILVLVRSVQAFLAHI